MDQASFNKNHEFRLLIVAAIICIAFILGGLGFISAVQSRSYADNLTYIEDETLQQRSALAQHFNSDFQILRGVSTSFSAIGLAQDDILQDMLMDISGRSSFVRMGLASLDGNVNLVDVDGSVYENHNFSHHQFFQRALAGKETVSVTSPSVITGEYVNCYGVPVYDEQGIAAILCAVSSATPLTDILSASAFQGQGSFTIIDGNGRITAPPIGSDPVLETDTLLSSTYAIDASGEESFQAALVNHEPTCTTAKIGANSYIITIEPLDVNNWSLASIVPSSFINTYYQETAQGVTLIVALAGMIFLFLLIVQRRLTSKNQARLEHIAFTDLLTGLPNYTKFKLDADKTIETNPKTKYAIWSIDFRRFKNVNSIFGNKKGNELLRKFGTSLFKSSASTLICCRESADNFVGISPYKDEIDISRIFNSFVAILDTCDVIPADQMHLTLAAGFYCIADFSGEPTIEEMANRAEIAKQAAKNSAGNTYKLFSEKMEGSIRREVELAALGLSAMEEGAITFALQPKVNIQGDNRIAGAEVLARWHHPEYGWVSPEEFIQVFEQNGLIVQFDRYIFNKACAWYRSYLDKGYPPLNLGVNVSRFGLMRNDLVAYYVSTRNKYQLDKLALPLELEFTESILLENYEIFATTVKQLQKEGFSCSIDDFGSGYSSLNVLKNLPINVLKFDSAFFQNAHNKHREKIVVRNLVSMVRKLSITTVAEGIEEKEQVVFLKNIGCDIVQGYVFSEPISRERFEALVANTRGVLPL